MVGWIRNTFTGPFNFYGHYIQLNGNTFNSTVDITRYGTSNDISIGGNVFNGTTILRDSSLHSNIWFLAYSDSDDFNGDVTFIQKGTGVNIYPSYSKKSNFSGNISIDAPNSNLIFGANGGNTILDGSQDQVLYKLNTYVGSFKKMAINKMNGNLILNSPIIITDSLTLIKGAIISDSTCFLTINDNGVTLGGSDSSFVQGPMKKIGNDPFVFPLGAIRMMTPYHPLSITAPSATTETFTATYFSNAHPNRMVLDTLLLSTSEYWRLLHDVGTSQINVSISWNANSSIIKDTTKMVVTTYQGSNWVNLGKGTIVNNAYFGMISPASLINLNQSSCQDFLIGKLNSSSSIGQLVDPFPFRGLYVKHFTPKPVQGYISILGNEILENEILTFARENNFRRLDLYGLYRIMYRLNDINPNSPNSNTFEVDLCNFLNKARNEYCIDEIAGVGGGSGDEFDDINDFNEGDLTPAYILNNSTIVNLATQMPYLNFLEETYQVSDGEIAKRAEIMKLFLRLNDYSTTQRQGGGAGCVFDIMTTEIEFWNPDNNVFPLRYSNWTTFSAVMPWLKTLQTLMSTTQTPFRIHCYAQITDQFVDPNGSTILPMDQADVADENSDKIYSVSYVSITNNTWFGANSNPIRYNCNPTTILFFGSNQFANTIVSPLLSADYTVPPWYTGIGWWMHQAEMNTLQLYEKSIWFDPLFNATSGPPTGILGYEGNSVLTFGSTQWWNALSSRMVSANNTWQGQDPSLFYPSYCTNNVAFYVNGQPEICDVPNEMNVCANNSVAFTYCSNYEDGVLVDWDFGDGTILTDTEPLDWSSGLPVFSVQNHTFQCEGQYIVSCTIHFRGVANSSCDYTYSRIVNVSGVNIQTSAETICDNADATLTACGGTSYLWSPGGQTTSSINVSPNIQTTYTVTATGTGACPSTAIATVDVLTGPIITITPTNTTCGGGATGGLNISCSNCVGTVTYSDGTTINTTGIFTGLIAGVYQCSVTDASGCVTSQSATIVATNLNVSVTGTNVSCNGNANGTAIANITGGSSPFNYLWSTGATTSSITNLSPNTYTCTVTDANNCSGMASVVITEPNVLTSVVTCSNCTLSGSMSAFSNPTGGTSPYTYSWNNGLYTTQNLQNLTSGNYNVLVTDANGCTTTGSIILADAAACVTGSGILNIGVSQPASYINSQGLYSVGMSIEIFSDWMVDANFTIDASQVYIYPNVKITVLPNCTLTVTNSSTLQKACSDPWQGIVIYTSNSKLVIDKDSHLRDALVGVDATNGSILKIDGALFDENDVCVNIKDYNNSGGNVSISSSIFRRASNVNGWPKIQGIVIQNATGPVIIDGGTSRNTFEALSNGIDIVGSNVTLKKNRFKDILCSYSNCLNGTRASVRASSGTNPTNLIVGGSSSDKCIFENCYSGIAAFNNVAMDVQFNEFNNTSYTNLAPSVGVTGVKSTGMTQTISHNEFKYYYYGINLFDVNSGIINIKENIFNNFTSVITNHNLRAITVASTILNSQGTVAINENLIKHHQRGIQVVNQYKSEVASNVIYLDNVTPNGFYGIRIQNSSASAMNNVLTNSVSRLGTSTSSIETSALGISVETGTGNLVKENTVTGFGTGIRFYNNITGNGALCNSLIENYEGITMEESNIGDQGSSGSASDNIWTRGTNTDAHLQAKGNSLSSIWYTQTSGSYYPNGSSDIRPSLYYTLSSATASSCASPCIDPTCTQEILARIVKEQGEFSDLDVSKKYLANKYAFELISKDSSLMYLNTANDSIIRVFYYAFISENIDLLTKIKEYLLVNDSTNAESANSSLTPENLSEENEKLFNQIYLETWTKSVFEFDSSQTANLIEIAYQNPISGGGAVYSARAMLNLDISDNIETLSERRRKLNHEYDDSEILSGKIIPNPSTGIFSYVLSTSLKSKGYLEIYDFMGNLVELRPVYAGQNEINFNMSTKVAGVYMIKLVSGEFVISHDKIIIQK